MMYCILKQMEDALPILEVAIFFFIAIGGWIPMGNVALQLEMQS